MPGEPKTHQRRVVPFLEELHDPLARQTAGKARDDLVFPARRGGVLRVNNFRRSHFDRAAGAIDVAGFTPHELRHTAASLAIASGADVKVVQTMLGHRSATLTLDRYGHLYPNTLGEVMARVSATRQRRARRFSADQTRTNRGPDRPLAISNGV